LSGADEAEDLLIAMEWLAGIVFGDLREEVVSSLLRSANSGW
jgi:hypothetical protein